MALVDPYAAYNARDSVEAHFLCNLIRDAGMKAHVIEDVSQVGVSAWTGLVPELHKTQVWIERSDSDRVKQILDDYELRDQARRDQKGDPEEDIWAETIQVVCDECEQALSFPVAQRGTVEMCPHCGRYVDVDDRAEEDEWWLIDGEDEAPSE